MSEPITLALTGDVMLGRHVAGVVAERGFAYPWGDVLPLVRQADLLLINLECALTARRERWSDGGFKPFHFRADPAAVASLTAAGVAFASLANNHAGDFGTEGMLDTIATLDRAGIRHAGAGRTLVEARAPARLAAGELRIAVVAFADHPAAWAATATAPGINYLPITVERPAFAAVEEALAAARMGADLVIASFHWGPNMRARPTPAFRAFARRAVEAGADVFWGHSAHVVQGIECWQGRPILYDTGDFIDDYRVDPELRNDLSALFLLRVRPPVIERVDLIPVQIGDCQVNLARGGARDWIVRRLEELCREMGTALEVGDGLGARVSITPQEQPEAAS